MFAHRLAGTLHCTVEELDDRVSPEQFFECLAFEQLSPPIGERADYLAAMICTIIANAWSKKRWKLDDFLPQWGIQKKKRSMTNAEIWSWAQRVNQRVNKQ